MHNLASIYLSEGKLAEAEELLLKTIEGRQRALGQDHANTLDTIYKLAQVYQNQDKQEQAIAVYTKVLDIRRRVLGPQHPDTADVLVSLAKVRLNQQRYAESESLLRQALTGYERAPDSWKHFRCESVLGAGLAAQKRYGEAEPLLLSGYQGMLRKGATIPFADRSELAQAGEWVVQLYADWGMAEHATKWQAMVMQPESPPWDADASARHRGHKSECSGTVFIRRIGLEGACAGASVIRLPRLRRAAWQRLVMTVNPECCPRSLVRRWFSLSPSITITGTLARPSWRAARRHACPAMMTPSGLTRIGFTNPNSIIDAATWATCPTV
jgi:hypothetical protein